MKLTSPELVRNSGLGMKDSNNLHYFNDVYLQENGHTKGIQTIPTTRDKPMLIVVTIGADSMAILPVQSRIKYVYTYLSSLCSENKIGALSTIALPWLAES